MALSTETLKAIMRDLQGFHLSDEEFELVRPELESCLAELQQLRGLDLSNVMSARLLRAHEGGQA
jgi:hypothetical protein